MAIVGICFFFCNTKRLTLESGHCANPIGEGLRRAVATVAVSWLSARGPVPWLKSMRHPPPALETAAAHACPLPCFFLFLFQKHLVASYARDICRPNRWLLTTDGNRLRIEDDRWKPVVVIGETGLPDSSFFQYDYYYSWKKKHTNETTPSCISVWKIKSFHE